ncbi:hypothetical protein ACTXT7_017011, partial [Hymenolepis weldensis]
LKLFLEEFGVKSVVLNSELPVASRCHTVSQFNRGLYDYLLATDENETGTVDEAANKSKFSKPAKDSEYGVSRGIDFKLVSNVLNFDFPLTATRYVHRVGRTARADQMGTAISFVNTTEEARLSDVANFLLQKDPSTLQSNKSDRTAVDSIFRPYQFRLLEVDAFRYRAADVIGKITRKRIREARLKEIKLELMNSERLRGYFEDHSADLDALRHDKPLSTAPQSHLKDVPDYMGKSSRGLFNLLIDLNSVLMHNFLVPASLQALIRGSRKRAKSRQCYKPSNWAKKGSEPGLSTSNSKGTSEKPIKLRKLKNHKAKMAIARDPAKVTQIKRQIALKKKANNPLFNFGKKGKGKK